VEPPSRAGEKCKCGGVLDHIDADFVAMDINDPLRRDIVRRIAIMLQRTFALYGDERVIVNVMRAVEETGDTMSVHVAADLLDEVNLSHRLMHVARELSGGEKQRVVLARQLAKSPMVSWQMSQRELSIRLRPKLCTNPSSAPFMTSR